MWHFSYNQVKSKVMTFKYSPNKQFSIEPPTIQLYGNIVTRVTDYVHVGIPLTSSLHPDNRAKDIASKMRGCLMSIMGSGISIRDIGCMTSTKLYKAVVLPRCLYGTELWHDITKMTLLS